MIVIGDRTSIFPASTTPVVTESPRNFLLKIDPVSAKKFNLDCFNQFKESPKGVSMKLMKGVHKHLALATKNPQMTPSCGEMIKIFSHFTNNGKVKDYVYKRMTKKVLLELAVCVVQ